jgi:hypothetical protein
MWRSKFFSFIERAVVFLIVKRCIGCGYFRSWSCYIRKQYHFSDLKDGVKYIFPTLIQMKKVVLFLDKRGNGRWSRYIISERMVVVFLHGKEAVNVRVYIFEVTYKKTVVCLPNIRDDER